MFTKTTLFHKPGEGGGSGGDQHNLGWYATPEALRTAHATATAGDWAIVGSTDTVWIWDTDTNAWKDSNQGGQVASVNGQTGTVVLTASDVSAATAAQGAKADTAVQPAAIADMETQTHASATYATKAELADKQNIIQYSTMPTASADNVGDIVQFVGTTTASYTNGYFYKCVSDGADPATYSWEAVEVQASSGGGLPDQTDQSGKFLTTNGTDASWSDKPFVNNSIDSTSIAILGGSQNEQVGRSKYRIVIGEGARVSGASNYNDIVIGYSATSSINTEGTNIVIGTSASGGGGESIAIGYGSSVKSKYSISIGRSAAIGGSKTYKGNIAIGYYAAIGNVHGAIQFNNGTNNESGTMCVALSTDGSTWNNYKLLDSDGTIPAARHAALPSADGTYVLKLVIADGVPTLSWVAE